jgi:hypothetical protein
MNGLTLIRLLSSRASPAELRPVPRGRTKHRLGEGALVSAGPRESPQFEPGDVCPAELAEHRGSHRSSSGGASFSRMHQSTSPRHGLTLRHALESVQKSQLGDLRTRLRRERSHSAASARGVSDIGSVMISAEPDRLESPLQAGKRPAASVNRSSNPAVRQLHCVATRPKHASGLK